MSKRVRLSVVLISALFVSYVVIGAVLGRGTSPDEKDYRDLGVYSEVLSRIQQEYVTKPNLKKVTTGAISGLLEALDPYSTYFTPQEYQDYKDHPDPGKGEVGIFLSKRMGFATVISVLPGSPAAKAGVSPGDLIDEVDGKRLRELSVVQIHRLLAGEPGTKVEVSIIKSAQGEPDKLALTRTDMSNPAVTVKTLDANTAYVHVPTFNDGESSQVAAKLKELIANGDNKIVLDLRNCAGGSEKEGEQTANLFLDHGLITYLYGQRFPRQNVQADPSKQVTKLPIVVLINQSTAGPAEIAAAAILDNKRGDVVGIRSFGVGVFQQLVPVGDGSALLLSVAKYYTPDGQAIADHGVTPNVVQAAETSVTPDQADENEVQQLGGPDDQQLQKALQILKQKNAPIKSAARRSQRLQTSASNYGKIVMCARVSFARS